MREHFLTLLGRPERLRLRAETNPGAVVRRPAAGAERRPDLHNPGPTRAGRARRRPRRPRGQPRQARLRTDGRRPEGAHGDGSTPDPGDAAEGRVLHEVRPRRGGRSRRPGSRCSTGNAASTCSRCVTRRFARNRGQQRHDGVARGGRDPAPQGRCGVARPDRAATHTGARDVTNVIEARGLTKSTRRRRGDDRPARRRRRHRAR